MSDFRKAGFAFSLLAAIAATSMAAAQNAPLTAPPKLSMVFDATGFFRLLKITSRDDRSIVVQRVVINKRYGNSDCDLKIHKVEEADAKKWAPSSKVVIDTFKHAGQLEGRSLHFADVQAVIANALCGNPIRVEVFTNQGDTAFDF